MLAAVFLRVIDPDFHFFRITSCRKFNGGLLVYFGFIEILILVQKKADPRGIGRYYF